MWLYHLCGDVWPWDWLCLCTMGFHTQAGREMINFPTSMLDRGFAERQLGPGLEDLDLQCACAAS